jgi:queuine tRNA-ribosyltransferase
MQFNFTITKKIPNSLGRLGIIHTPHGDIETPTFTAVGTKATVKAVTPAQLKEIGIQAVLANTYHLHLEPGSEMVAKAGGFAKWMGWHGPTFTDSGGFQAFSLGAAFGKKVSKIAKGETVAEEIEEHGGPLAHVDEEGVTFKSYRDGSEHRFTPERSMEIQWNLGADVIFAFDECTSPQAPYEYQKEAMNRTHRWAARSLVKHNALDTENVQALFGVVQGGQFEDLRRESARTLAAMDFDGFGIGGSFNKEDIQTAVRWVNEELPEAKPRHLLGIGEPADIFSGVEAGCDTFDCVSPTRAGRTGRLYTKDGTKNIMNAKFRELFEPIEKDCGCYTCKNFTASYLSHLFHASEMLGGTLATIHNLYFINALFTDIRAAIASNTFSSFKESFLARYTTSNV